MNERDFQNAFIAASKGENPQFMTLSPWGYQTVLAGWDEKRSRYVEMVRRICCDIERDWERQYGPQYQTSADDDCAKKLRAFKREAQFVAALDCA